MGDLAVDTAVERSDGHYQAQLSDEWRIWGPNGGYVATVALRAAGLATEFRRPATFYAHFLNVAEFDLVDISVTSIRKSKRAESLRVSMSQNDRPILEALVWAVAGGVGFEHDTATMPDVPKWNELKSAYELNPGSEETFPFWRNIEQRSVDVQTKWDERQPGLPRFRAWLRFQPTPAFEDPFVEAGRQLILCDTLMYPAATMAYPPPPPFMAPSLDVAVTFHRPGPASEWLYCQAEAPVGEEGLLGGSTTVWDEDGRLLASGGQQMLSRPWPGQEQ